MKIDNSPLSEVLQRLQSSLGLIRVQAHDEHRLVLQPGRPGSSLVTIELTDAADPMYSVTYVLISPEAKSVKEAATRTSVVMFEGLQWIVESIKTHGYVMPEYPHPQLVRSLKRAPREGYPARRGSREPG